MKSTIGLKPILRLLNHYSSLYRIIGSLKSDFSKSDAKNCFFKKPSASLCLTVLEHKEYTKLTGRVIIAGSSCGLECVMSSSTLSLPLIHFLTKVPKAENDAADAPPAPQKQFSRPQKEFLQSH